METEIRLRTRIIPLVAIVLVFFGHVTAETAVRIATYNIKYLNSNVGDPNRYGDRLAKLQEAIRLLEADVVALQEIDDRDALRTVFSANEWHLIIDDDSGENQDVAVAVRRTLNVPDFVDSLDADGNDFLFASETNNYFPDRRDVLKVRVQDPTEPTEFCVLVVHAKSRYGGRADNDWRRVGAARRLIERIRADFDDVHFILLGDFNDNPDDRSLNILETGNADAPAGPEEIPGPFVINLTEPLCAAGHVSHGLKSNAIRADDNTFINTVVATSREENNRLRGTNAHTGKILFDQILIPAWMVDSYVDGSCRVFDYAVAVRGNSSTRASDHVPVYADFVFVAEAPTAPTTEGLRIVALLPNPDGSDDNHEQVTLENPSAQAISLDGWKLVDQAQNEYAFSGSIPAHSSLTITMNRKAMLNNSGDTVWLVAPCGTEQPSVAYTSAQARSGATIRFD
jgi:endonuclease/exonuclease/phosphatase family metal-dependent hydrolase